MSLGEGEICVPLFFPGLYSLLFLLSSSLSPSQIFPASADQFYQARQAKEARCPCASGRVDVFLVQFV